MHPSPPLPSPPLSSPCMQYGFITYQADGERSSIFFHKSNAEGGGEAANLRVGDEVCFVVTTHHKTQKKQAICVKKTG